MLSYFDCDFYTRIFRFYLDIELFKYLSWLGYVGLSCHWHHVTINIDNLK